MKLVRCIPPQWLNKPVLEGVFPQKKIVALNRQGYNIYYFPNYPKEPPPKNVEGKHIDTFEYVFVDMDLKDGIYASKEAFLEAIDIPPNMVCDSGNGIHVYWKVDDLDAMAFLKLSRRLMRKYNTDPAVNKICQLMRLSGTYNTKNKDNRLLCQIIHEDLDARYTCEGLDKLLPPITIADDGYCTTHYNSVFNPQANEVDLDVMPPKFGEFIHSSHEAKKLWTEITDDRSGDDYRLAHLLFANEFTREEAVAVLSNSAKALTRQPVHRLSYANNMVNKIWTYNIKPDKALSKSVGEILSKNPETLKGVSFRCHPRIDNTEHGFCLGHVMGLVAGSGVGKTAFALNIFKWFAERNPDYHHFFIPLEQPSHEIALRWQTMCGEGTSLHNKVHVISNYDDNGNFRHLSLDEIRVYIEEWQKTNNLKIGCVVIDHIGALKKKGLKGENQDIMDICHKMKSFAVQTNTFLIMQSQTSRQKAGIGDLELDKDAAYGTIYFESYVDYLVTLWQPLKRCHHETDCPTVTAFKFCKIRHKKAKRDIIQEDVPYYFYFDSERELLTDMTQLQANRFDFYVNIATSKRKADKKTDLVEYKSVDYEGKDANTSNDRHTPGH